MSIKYEVQRIENSKGSGKPQQFVRLRRGSAMTADEIEKEIEESTTATSGDVRAVMAELCHLAKRELSAGNNFYLPEIGYLSLSVGSTPVEKTTKGKITGNDIYLRNIDFRPKAKFLNEIRGNMSFEKSRYTTMSAQYTEDEIWAKVEAYLSSHRYVTNLSMRSEFGLSQYKAKQWLDRFVEQGRLTKEGTSKHRLYFKA